VRQPDGTWHVEGVKRFITSAEHDLEREHHPPRARAPGGARTGHQGDSRSSSSRSSWSTFETGALGERNGVYATNVEKKMGLKVSTTCEVTFGEQHPAVGYLLGEVHDGIAQMFHVIEAARMMVGTKAIATLSTGYLNALDYAKTRVQGPDLTRMTDKTAPRVTITHHPDVRRSLMFQKSYAEGMRALVLYNREHPGRRDGRHRGRRGRRLRRAPQRPAAADRQGLRLRAVLRVARAVAADPGRVRLPAGLPDRAVHPGREDRHPVRGDDRDPGMDFFFRKIVRDKGQALTRLLTEISGFARGAAGGEALATSVRCSSRHSRRCRASSARWSWRSRRPPRTRATSTWSGRTPPGCCSRPVTS
jgi:hypothetical protein